MNYTEKLYQAVFHYELSLSLTGGNWEKSCLKKNIADALFFICNLKKLQGLPIDNYKHLFEITLRLYSEAEELARASLIRPQTPGWFHRLEERQNKIAEWSWRHLESSCKDFNIRRVKLQQFCLILSGFPRSQYHLKLVQMFLEHAKLLKKNKRLQESLQVLTANKLNIEEARKHECFVEQARILENRNDFKLHNLQVTGQYSEKQLKESFLGKKFHLWLYFKYYDIKLLLAFYFFASSLSSWIGKGIENVGNSFRRIDRRIS